MNTDSFFEDMVLFREEDIPALGSSESADGGLNLLDWHISPLWALVAAGIVLTGVASVVIYETFMVMLSGSGAWLSCLQGEGIVMATCGEPLNTAYVYRFGMDASWAMVLAIFAAFVGPIPLIAMIQRYRNNLASGVLFFAVMIPYGILGFIVVVLSLLVAVMYGMEIMA